MWIFGGNFFCRFSPGQTGLNIVTENFTAFFTARQEFVTWISLWETPRLTNSFHQISFAFVFVMNMLGTHKPQQQATLTRNYKFQRFLSLSLP